MFTQKNLPHRLASKITVDDGCWVWTGAKNSRGYGSISVTGRGLLAHRYIFELAFGPIPEGMTLDHMCERTSCVHPYHLNVETSADNTRLRFTRHVQPREAYVPSPRVRETIANFISVIQANTKLQERGEARRFRYGPDGDITEVTVQERPIDRADLDTFIDAMEVA
jgi:hypothetical protein